ncbi:MAG: T9SS type A sorting domain-containing protein [Weeksellaceae bacterium]
MKKIIVSAFLCLFMISGYAQNQDFEVLDLDGNPYVDGQTYVYNVHGTFGDPINEAKLFFVFHNPTAEQIKIYGQVLEFTNTDGSMAQFCIIDACYFPLVEGGLYPAQGGFLAPGEYNGQNETNYFINLDDFSPVEYKFRIYQANVDTGEEIPNTTFEMNYRYDASMGVSDVQTLAIAQVYPTVVKGFTNVSLNEDANVQVLNTEGKIVKKLSMKKGQSQLDLNGLSAGVYWVTFKGVSGVNTNIRVLVK